MNILKKIIFAIFCPLNVFSEHNGVSKMVGTKYEFFKYFVMTIVAAAVILFIYFVHKELI